MATDPPTAADAALEDNLRDKLVAVGKPAASFIPFLGGPLGEILSVSIPGQRADRIASYLRQLSLRVDQLSDDLRRDLASSKEKIDLIEEGGVQATRALSEKRIGHIVEAVSNGLNRDDAEVIRRKRLLAILGQLDDDEVVLLNAYGSTYGGGSRDAWHEVNAPEPVHMNSSREAHNKMNLFEAGEKHLERLGLLSRTFPFVRHGQLPEFDTFKGDFKHSLQISSLGRLLLSEIGMPTPFDREA